MRKKKSHFDIFGDLDEMFNEMMKEMQSGKLPREDSNEPFVYGFSWSQRSGEEPEIREFGNVYPGRGHVEIGERRPLVDVFDTDGSVQVVAEMPGIEKEDVQLDLDEKSLEIKAERGERRYNEVVELPADVDIDSTKATYKNGVLEIVLKKTEKKGRKKKIKVD